MNLSEGLPQSYLSDILQKYGLTELQFSAFLRNCDASLFHSTKPSKRLAEIHARRYKVRLSKASLVSEILDKSPSHPVQIGPNGLLALHFPIFLEPKRIENSLQIIESRVDQNYWHAKSVSASQLALYFNYLGKKKAPESLDYKANFDSISKYSPQEFADFVFKYTADLIPFLSWRQQQVEHKFQLDKSNFDLWVFETLNLNAEKMDFLVQNFPTMQRDIFRSANQSERWVELIDSWNTNIESAIYKVRRMLYVLDVDSVTAKPNPEDLTQIEYSLKFRSTQALLPYLIFKLAKRLGREGFKPELARFYSHNIRALENTESFKKQLTDDSFGIQDVPKFAASRFITLLESDSKTFRLAANKLDNLCSVRPNFQRTQKIQTAAKIIYRSSMIAADICEKRRLQQIDEIIFQAQLRMFESEKQTKYLKTEGLDTFKIILRQMERLSQKTVLGLHLALQNLNKTKDQNTSSSMLINALRGNEFLNWDLISASSFWLIHHPDLMPEKVASTEKTQEESFAEGCLAANGRVTWSQISELLDSYGSRLALSELCDKTTAEQTKVLTDLCLADVKEFCELAQVLVEIDFNNPKPWEARTAFEAETTLTRNAYRANKLALISILEGHSTNLSYKDFITKCTEHALLLFPKSEISKFSKLRDRNDHLLNSAYSNHLEIVRILDALKEISN